MANIVLISGHYFGKRLLDGILSSPSFESGKLNIKKILALHPKNSYNIVGFFDFTASDSYSSIPISTFDKISSDSAMDELSSISHDYLLAVGLSQLLPSELLDMPKLHNSSMSRYGPEHGAIGMHPTLLPKGRGRAPIPWTIIKGLSESGVSSFFLDEKPDAGPIIDSEPFQIDEYETATTLFDKVSNAHQLLGMRLASAMEERNVIGVPQLEELATFWAKRTPSDGWLDFGKPADQLHRQIRALANPYPNAFFCYRGAKVYVRSAEIAPNEQESSPGLILDHPTGDPPRISTADGCLILLDWISDSDCPDFRIGEKVFASAF